MSSSAKTLCQCVLEGHFTRETLARVMKYQHDSWEMPLNQVVRKHPHEWDKVQHYARHLASQHYDKLPKELKQYI
jgi:hypothetical protein